MSALETEVKQLNEYRTSLAEDKEGREGLVAKLNRDVEALQRPRLDSSSSHSGSQKTLEGSGDSETESNTRLQLAEADFNREGNMGHTQCKRPSSSSVVSTESDRTTASGPGAMRGYTTSESEVPDSQTSAMESSDSISFDGEYDDSIMFSGIKQRYNK